MRGGAGGRPTGLGAADVRRFFDSVKGWAGWEASGVSTAQPFPDGKAHGRAQGKADGKADGKDHAGALRAAMRLGSPHGDHQGKHAGGHQGRREALGWALSRDLENRVDALLRGIESRAALGLAIGLGLDKTMVGEEGEGQGSGGQGGPGAPENRARDLPTPAFNGPHPLLAFLTVLAQVTNTPPFPPLSLSHSHTNTH